MYTLDRLWLQALCSRPIPFLIAACGRQVVANATFHAKKWRCQRSAIVGKAEERKAQKTPNSISSRTTLSGTPRSQAMTGMGYSLWVVGGWLHCRQGSARPAAAVASSGGRPGLTPTAGSRWKARMGCQPLGQRRRLTPPIAASSKSIDISPMLQPERTGTGTATGCTTLMLTTRVAVLRPSLTCTVKVSAPM